MITLPGLFSVFVGGGIGATFRWLLGIIAVSFKFGPWVGTLASNLIGCLLIFIFSEFFGMNSSLYIIIDNKSFRFKQTRKFYSKLIFLFFSKF